MWAHAEVDPVGSVPLLRDSMVAGNLPCRLARQCGEYYNVQSHHHHNTGAPVRTSRTRKGPAAEVSLQDFLLQRPYLMRYTFQDVYRTPADAEKAIIAVDDPERLDYLRSLPGWGDAPVLPNNAFGRDLKDKWVAGAPSVTQASWAAQISLVRWTNWELRNGPNLVHYVVRREPDEICAATYPH
jgi:hypothetical protein